MKLKNIRGVFGFAPLTILMVIIPNSFNEIAGSVLIINAAIVSRSLKIVDFPLRLAVFLALSSLITVIYLFIGAMQGAPDLAIYTIPIIYVVSPVLWSIVFAYLTTQYSVSDICRFLSILIIPCAASIALFFFLFINFGSDAVLVFISTPNITIEDGSIAATMHVFGSLLFLSGGIFAAPKLIKSIPLRLLIMLSALTAAFVSGRGALVVAIFVGVSVGFLSSVVMVRRLNFKTITSTIFVIFFIVISLPFLEQYFQFDFQKTIANLVTKILTDSSDVRGEQSTLLMNGIFDSGGFGAGHGIGVNYIRDAESPWKYETVWVATVFRVGIFGTLVYLAAFLYTFSVLITRVLRRSAALEDKFVLGGFAAAFIASNTNPYLEAFSFQWMYVFPIVYACTSSKRRRFSQVMTVLHGANPALSKIRKERVENA